MAKYKLTNETTTIFGITLYRIEALKDFSDIKKGDKGGWVEKEANLSQHGNCWISDEACVFGNARVFFNALVFGNAWVYDEAWVYDNTRVFDDAMVYGSSRVYDNSKVYGNARIFDAVHVCDNVRICGHVQIYGKGHVSDDTKVCGVTHIYHNSCLIYDQPTSVKKRDESTIKTKDTCILCGNKDCVEVIAEDRNLTIRGTEITVTDIPFIVCGKCGSKYEEHGSDYMRKAFTLYREKYNKVTPEEIKALSSKCGDSFLRVIGLSKERIKQLENGALASEEEDSKIRDVINMIQEVV